MQGSSPWYTPTTSALHNQQTNNSNYFYSYSQPWERSVNGYQQDYYNRPGQYPVNNNMRTCNENQGFGAENGNNYHCPPMYFRQDIIHPEGSSNHNARPRTDRNHPCNQNGNNPNCGQPMPNSTKVRHSKGMTKSNDCETENFSSVFTQSLTSLYSQDTEANFEEKNYKCDPDAPPNDSELASSIRPKTEDLSNTCNTEYSFSSVFNTDMDQQHPPGMNSFENLKVKQEFPDMEIENTLRYDNYSLDDTYLKRRRSLAEAYNRKRKRSSVPSMSYRTPVDVDGTDTKASERFHSQSQWIPNSIQACQTNETSSNDTYQTSEFSSVNQSANYDAFENVRGYKRHPVKPRGSRGRPSTKETRVQNAIKRIPKKVSPLTVYAKVLDDRVLEVTCRRYKKRTKPSTSEESFIGQSQNDNGVSKVNESWENTYHSVGKVIRHLVDKVTALSIPKRTIDLSLISPIKAKELLLRFCSDYTLDYRDFQDFNEVLRANVVNESEENISRNRKGRTAIEREEYNTRKNEKIDEKDKEEIIENEQKRERSFNKEVYEKNSEKCVEKAIETKPPPKQERKVGRPKKQQVVKEEQQRVLRSLPSRQPGNKITKKTRKTERQVKSRYPKRRTARGGRGGRGKKLKILIDLSKEDSGPAEVLELESDSSRQTVASKADKDDVVEEDDDEDVKEIDKKEKEIGDQSQTAQESPHPSCHSENEDEEGKKHPEIDISATIEEDEKQESENPSAKAKESNPPDPQPCASPEIKDVEETLKNIKKEVDEDETRLRQPPQLVCMAPEDRSMDKLFLEPSQGKSATNSAGSSSEGRLSPMYLQANGMEDTEAPSPPKLKRTSATKYHRSFSGESSSSDFMAIDSDDPDGKLVIDMDPPESQQEKTDNESETKDEEKNVIVVTSESLEIDMKSIEFEEASKSKESTGDDDCVVINPRPKSPVEIIDLVVKQKPTNQGDQHSLLKEKLLEKPILNKVEDQLLEIQKAVMTPPDSEKYTSKAEQDESILRTLLLESEVMASTSSADGNVASISNVIAIPGQEATANLDFLKNVDTKISQLPNFPTDPPIALNDAFNLLKYQAYQDTYSSSPETLDDSSKQAKDGTVPPAIMQADSKESASKDPQQLKEKIKKLKNEITYLQMMAEQKEKEKIAIVCFKRYKEEILRRIYKAYAYSVQDHVRDWIFSRRENSGENRLPAESSPNAHKVHRNESSRISEAARIAAESCKDLYPVPAPAHAATNHRPQSIHSPQSLPKNHRNPQQTGEKVSTVETMVAKATENYGLDMRNLRDGLRTSPDAPVVSGTILQKVLSSSSSQNSSPDQHRSWSPERAHKKSSTTTKPIQPLVSKPYTEPYAAPLDMIMPHKESSQKNSEIYRNSPEVSRPAKPFQGSERSQIQSLLSEPVHLKANRNPYRAWSIQAGGRISEDRAKHSKPVSSVLRHSPNTSAQANPANVESPLQRQLNSHKVVSRPNFAIPSSLETTRYSQQSSLLERGERSSTLIAGEQTHDKKPSEDRLQHSFGSTALSSNSTMPYGGHIIRNNSSPLTTTVTSNKTSISAAQGSSNPSNSTNSTPLCMGCGVSDAKFICSGCREHWYCSPQCQSLRWPEHSRVCAGRMFSQSASSYS